MPVELAPRPQITRPIETFSRPFASPHVKTGPAIPVPFPETPPMLQVPELDVSVNRDYNVKDNSRITRYGDDILTGPNGPKSFLDEKSLIHSAQTLDIKALLKKGLPNGMTEADLIGIFKLSMLTECATDAYGVGFDITADKYNQPWLRKFNNQVWKPDEYTHHLPSQVALMQMGFSEAELFDDIMEARQRSFQHLDGHTPGGFTLFGMVQEYLTDEWYGGIVGVLKDTNPEAASGFLKVKRREGHHFGWYRDFSTFQIEEDPGLLEEYAEITNKFKMPFYETAPYHGASGDKWLEQMGFDTNDKGRRNIIRAIKHVVGSSQELGKFGIEYAEQAGMRPGGLDIARVHEALDKHKKIGGPAYGIVGEVLLKKVGIEIPRDTLLDKMRGKIVDWTANQLDFKL